MYMHRYTYGSVCVCVRVQAYYGQVQQSFRFVSFALALPPIPLGLSINRTSFQLVTSWKDFTIFTWGVWQCLRVCVCVCVYACVCVHVTVFRSAFLFAVRVNEWKM